MTLAQSTNWAVIGGGFLGMTLALRLAQQGRSVSLFEGSDFLGGVAAPWKLGDIVWDRHYHVISANDTRLLSLLNELGIERDLRWQKTRTGIYVDANLFSLSNVWEFLRFPPLGIVDKVRLAATILHASSIRNPEGLESVLVCDWLQKWSGKKVLEKIWRPLLRAKLGESYKETSAAFIWTSIVRMYGARRSSAKQEFFGYVDGGYLQIIGEFARALRNAGVNLLVGHRVTLVHCEGSKLQVQAAGTSRSFDHVVFTTPGPIAAKACRDLTASEKAKLDEIPYLGIVCPSLLLNKPLLPFYVTNIAEQEIPFTAIIGMSNLIGTKKFDGNSLVYLPKYTASDSAYFQLNDEEIKEQFLCGLYKMFPGFNKSHVVCFQVSRVKYLVPIPTLNYSRKLPVTNTSVPGLHIVNSAQITSGTLNVNEVIALAERAAEGFSSTRSFPNDHYAFQEINETYRQPVA